MNNQEQIPKMFCRMCGGRIDRDSKFCPLCGKKLEDSPMSALAPNVSAASIIPAPPTTPVQPAIPTPTQMSTGDQNIQQDAVSPTPTRKPGKGIVIGGICAAVLVLAVIIGVAVNGSTDKKDPEPSYQYAMQESAEPIQDPQQAAELTSEPQKPWADNVLMTDTIDEGFPGDDRIWGSNITRKEIGTITFLDSLDTMSADAWDVSADGSGNVMAWVVQSGEYYDLYIGGAGGVSTGKDCSYLFYSMFCVETIETNRSLHTENATTMECMFEYCSALPNVDLNGFDTSNVTNMRDMFLGCENLKMVDASSFDTSSVTDMNGMFTNCKSLTSLDVSNFGTSNVTNMGYMFDSCESLTSLDLSSFDTSRVTDMEYMFDNCKSLTSLNVSSFDTSRVTDMNRMFMHCESLTGLNVSNFDTSSVTDMGSMFSSCESLTSLDVSNFDTSSATNMQTMFKNCKKLTHLDISNFRLSDTEIYGMFVNCNSLEDLDLSNFTESQIKAMYDDGWYGW